MAGCPARLYWLSARSMACAYHSGEALRGGSIGCDELPARVVASVSSLRVGSGFSGAAICWAAHCASSKSVYWRRDRARASSMREAFAFRAVVSARVVSAAPPNGTAMGRAVAWIGACPAVCRLAGRDTSPNRFPACCPRTTALLFWATPSAAAGFSVILFRAAATGSAAGNAAA